MINRFDVDVMKVLLLAWLKFNKHKITFKKCITSLNETRKKIIKYPIMQIQFIVMNVLVSDISAYLIAARSLNPNRNRLTYLQLRWFV